MQVSNPNNIKIYNLSAGKSLPQWLSDRKRRKLQQKDVDIQRRIELLQDFEMPTVSSCITVTKDKQHIIAAGVYKPRIRCYDVNNLSMKFERCIDYAAIKVLPLQDDFRKLVLLQEDRHIEFHAQYGRYYRTRIPRHGRDLAHYYASADLYMVGTGPEIFRLNLELGQFLAPLETDATMINCCQFNPEHYLFSCGTKESGVECWDPRSRRRAGILHVTDSTFVDSDGLKLKPEITALQYKDALNFAVGTSTGHVALYDLRSTRPLLVKDHRYGLPIHSIQYHTQQRLVLASDSNALKMWSEDNGKPFTAIETENKINDMCVYPDSGLLFMATEAPKMLVYYIPTLGSAPRWCSFLDSLTEELEETAGQAVYDDYRFVTRVELDQLQLTHLIGSQLLRAYMHGFFIDNRLYNKAKSIADPFAYDSYRKAKIREKIEEERAARVKLKKALPKVNRALAEKLREQSQLVKETEGRHKKIKEKAKERAEGSSALLSDPRFGAMFTNPDFEVDVESEEYRLVNPIISSKDKRDKDRLEQSGFVSDSEDEEIMARLGAQADDGEESDEGNMESPKSKKKKSSKGKKSNTVEEDTEELPKKKRREQYVLPANTKESEYRDAQLLEVEEVEDLRKKTKKKKKLPLGERADMEEDVDVRLLPGSSGAREMTFKLKPKAVDSRRDKAKKEHVKERKSLRRQAPPGGGKYVNKFFR